MPETSIQEKAENRIIDFINLNAAGRLIVFKPLPAGRQAEKGPDLVVKKKGEYNKIEEISEAQKFIIKPKTFGRQGSKQVKELKIYIFVKNKGEVPPNSQWADLPKTDPDVYSIFILFDPIRQDVEEKMWVVKQGSGFIVGKDDLSKMFLQAL